MILMSIVKVYNREMKLTKLASARVFAMGISEVMIYLFALKHTYSLPACLLSLSSNNMPMSGLKMAKILAYIYFACESM